MNKEKVHQSLDHIEVPEERLIQREKAALLQARKSQKRRKTTTYSSLIACGLCITLLGFGFISPGMAKTLSQVPIIGPIYAQFNDIASEKIEQDKLATSIEKQDSRNGLTMNVKEAVYDGGRLVVTVEYKGDEPLSMVEENIGHSEITINGEKVETIADSTTGQAPVNGNTIIESHQFTFAQYGEFGDKIDVGIHGEDLFGKKGKWEVTFPLVKIDGNIQEFTPNITAKTKDEVYTLTTNKVAFTPLSTRIDLTVDYPEEMEEKDTWPWFMYIVTDDKGNVYKFRELNLQIGVLEMGRHIVLTLPPMETLPKSFTILPYDDRGQANPEETGVIEDLKMIVPLR